jgi:hypothetical protein
MILLERFIIFDADYPDQEVRADLPILFNTNLRIKFEIASITFSSI